MKLMYLGGVGMMINVVEETRNRTCFGYLAAIGGGDCG